MTETNAERLEEVKKSAKWLHCFMGPVDVKSISEDMNWLIEQVQELEARNHSLSEESRGNFQATLDCRRENKRLLQAINGLSKAVEIYSDKPCEEAMKDLIKLAEVPE